MDLEKFSDFHESATRCGPMLNDNLRRRFRVHGLRLSGTQFMQPDSLSLRNSLRMARAEMNISFVEESVKPDRSRQTLALPALGIGVLLLLAVGPLFVRMPLTNDTVFFDLQTRLFARGAVPYRDILEPNWPGVFWIHSGVRQVLGPHSEAMRFFDLLSVVALSWMLRNLVVRAGATPQSSNWISVAVLGFYFSCSEWCHCQRDTWLLVPMAAATLLRMRRLSRTMNPRVSALATLAEGLIWGAACWLKPYAALIGVSVWLVTLPRFSTLRQAAFDTFGVFIGGMFAGIGGIAWLVRTGAWSSWLETMRVWNPRYLAAGRENWVLSRFEPMLLRMQPWYALHVLAIPLAIGQLIGLTGAISNGRRDPTNSKLDSAQIAGAVLAAMYLATLGHVFFLQHLFDYVHAPAVLLSIVIVGVWIGQPKRDQRWRFAALAFGVAACWQSPLMKSSRLQLWWECVTRPNSAKLQDRLAHFSNPRRVHLERIAEFLRSRVTQDAEVGIFNSDLVGLYQRLNLRPPTRFVYLMELLVYFPEQRAEMMAELESSQHRFVVTDLASCGMPLRQSLEVGPDGPNAPPPTYRPALAGQYPWSHPVVFRSGPYLVHEISGQLGRPQSLPRNISKPSRG